MQQPNTVANMFDIIGQAMKPYTELMRLSAIWYNRKRFAPGDFINYDPTDEEIIVPDTITSTHKIISCMGTLDNSRLEMEVKDLNTLQHITIKL